MIEIDVKYIVPANTNTQSIRTLFRTESCTDNPKDRNPLAETEFNNLLNAIAQEAFDEGRRFKYPSDNSK